MILLCGGLQFVISIKSLWGPHKTDWWATSKTPAHWSTYFLPCGGTCALELWWFHLKASVSVRQHFVCNEHKLCSWSSPTKVINQQIRDFACQEIYPFQDTTWLRSNMFIALNKFPAVQNVAVLLKPCGHKRPMLPLLWLHYIPSKTIQQ
jgi:hypothetical protein